MLLYVDDVLIACKHMSRIDILEQHLKSKFEIKDLAPAKMILGVELIVNKKKGTIFFTQQKYVHKILEKFGIAKTNLFKQFSSSF